MASKLCKDQCCCLQLVHTASALITKTSGTSSSFQVDVFVFYVYGSSSSSWEICVLPVSRPSCVCVRQHVHSLSVNPRDIYLLYSHMDSLRNFTRRLQEKFQKMSRTTWVRLQVWKQRQWCLVKVLYFHTWTQFNWQLSWILYTWY